MQTAIKKKNPTRLDKQRKSWRTPSLADFSQGQNFNANMVN